MRVKGPFLVEIDRLKAVNQQLEIELADLKAITELAVKGLQKVCDRYAGEYEQRIIAKNTLSEIKRIQNEQT